MQYSIRIIKSIKDIAETLETVLDNVNYIKKIVNQSWIEVLQNNEIYCKLIEVPKIINDLGIKGADLKDAKFLEVFDKGKDIINETGEIVNTIESFAKNISSLSGNSILSEVIKLQFNVDSTTFTECKNVIEMLKNKSA